MDSQQMNAARLARLRFIDMLLEHYGTFNRSVVEDFYGLSTVQVSLDIQQYCRIAPENMEYDKSARTYRRTPTFKRHLP